MKTSGDTCDLLFDFELKVARRADELAHDATMHGRSALELWCEAERQTASPFGGHVDSPKLRISD